MVLAAARSNGGLLQTLGDAKSIVQVTQNEDDAVAFAYAGARVLHKTIFEGLSVSE